MGGRGCVRGGVRIRGTTSVDDLTKIIVISLSTLATCGVNRGFGRGVLFSTAVFVVSLVVLVLAFTVFHGMVTKLFAAASDDAAGGRMRDRFARRDDRRGTGRSSMRRRRVPSDLRECRDVLIRRRLGRIGQGESAVVTVHRCMIRGASGCLSGRGVDALFRGVRYVTRGQIGSYRPVRSAGRTGVYSPSLERLT